MSLLTTKKERDCLILYGVVKHETVDRLGEDGGHDPELSFDVALAKDCNALERQLAWAKLRVKQLSTFIDSGTLSAASRRWPEDPPENWSPRGTDAAP